MTSSSFSHGLPTKQQVDYAIRKAIASSPALQQLIRELSIKEEGSCI